MSGVPETDVELLRCAPPVDITLFPDAQANRIAQDFGRCLPFIYLDIILTAFSFIYGQIRENISKYFFFFDRKGYSSDRSIQAIFGRLHTQSPGRLHRDMVGFFFLNRFI